MGSPCPSVKDTVPRAIDTGPTACFVLPDGFALQVKPAEPLTGITMVPSTDAVRDAPPPDQHL